MSRRIVYLVVVVLLLSILLPIFVYFFGFKQESSDPLRTLTFYTEQWPPYSYIDNGTVKGLSVDLLSEITDKMGGKITPDVHLTSWTEGYRTTLTSNNTVIFSTARLPEREQFFKWAGPIFTDSYVLFSQWNREITLNSSKDLVGYRIGVITDDAAVQQLKNAGVDDSKLVYDSNATTLIRKLSSGEIDLWCYPKAVGRALAGQVTGNYYLFKTAFALQSVDFYYAFNKNTPDSTVQSFQQALDALKQDRDSTGTNP